ncbi:hypothetical protein, partial [uncultured Sphingobacterium sp.]|uniref:hypothetical protein n=1 Tax=uncultured Sphingobacterium sp. TaxID=182688 RepID=UPI00374958D6
RSTGPSVSPVHRKLFRNRRYPAACIDRIKSYYFLAVSYSCISASTARATSATSPVKLYCFSSVSYCCISMDIAVATCHN